MKRPMIILVAFALSLLPLTGMTGDPCYASDSADVASSPSPMTTLSTFSSGLTVEGIVSLSRGNFAIQMGAFSRLANAEKLRSRLEEILEINVEIVEEEGMYKVFINSELRESAPSLFVPVSFNEPARRRTTHQAADAGVKAESVSSRSDISVASPVNIAASAASIGASRESTVTHPDSTVAPPDTLTTESDADAVAEQSDTTAIRSAAVTGDAEVIPPAAGEETSVGRGIDNLFFLKGNSPWLTRFNYFDKSVALVNALIFTIIASMATMLILLLVILLNRNRMEKEAKLRQYLMEQYQSLIVDYLFGNTGSEQFMKIASDNFRRQVLIDQMIDVSVNLKGESEEKLMNLYRELNLDQDSLARARSRKWHKKIKGFRELAFVGITDGNDEIYRALNSRNEILRMEAQIALVRLSDTGHFEFLSQLKRPFSLWEQITLHDLIIQHELPVPAFSQWLSSENPTVVMFALRMIREFKQKDAEQEIKKVLLHRDPAVSQLAVEVAGDLDIRSTLDTMKRMYKFQEYNNCLEIVKSMGKMPEQAMLGFLKLVLDKEDDVQLQIEAVKAIENMGEPGVQALVKVMKSEYKNYNIIVRHVLDRRIY
ncbi:MAG: SPOR domain-containing protein [Bacteroidales bacterium]|nr:SPOR domain-containing protein [Bacteroidales bacterium]